MNTNTNLTIYFDKGCFMFEATVIDQTDKAYKCTLKSYVAIINDRVGDNHGEIWLPKSVVKATKIEGIAEIQPWFAKQIKVKRIYAK
jgi:hypothetical protein